MIDVEVFSKAGIGKDNEDYALHTEIAPDVALTVVCDGMGGLSDGADASRIVAHSIENYLRKNFCSQKPEHTIVNAILYANDELAKECRLIQSKMGGVGWLDLICWRLLLLFMAGRCQNISQTRRPDRIADGRSLAIEGNHSFLTRCINGREFRYSPVVADMTLQSGDEVFIVTDGYYLHHNVGTPIEAENTTEDDATIVCIKLI